MVPMVMRSIGAVQALILAVAVAALLGCTVRLVSSYDEQTDQSVTALQKKVDSFLIGLERGGDPPACTYPQHRGFYDEARVDIGSLQVRVDALPQNDITKEQVKLLASSLDTLEQLHQRRCLSKEEIEPLRSNFNTSFTAILKLELAKKRGEVK